MSDSEVNVKITAQSDQFDSAVHKSDDTFKGFSTNLNTHLGDLREHFALAKEAVEGFFVALAVEKIAELEDHFGNLAEQIARTSAMTGLTTEAVQEFNFAVTMSGGNAESASTTLERLEKNMAEAGNKTSQAALAFKAMDISATNADGSLRPINAVLADIANYFNKTADGAAKTALAMQIMGRGGAQLIPVLNKGSEGLDDFNQKLEETNSKMSGEQLDAYTRLDESIKVLSAAWSGFSLAVADFFRPAAEAIVTWLTEIIEKATEAAKWVDQVTHSFGYAKYAPENQNTPAEKANKPQAATPQTAKQIADAKTINDAKLAQDRDYAEGAIAIAKQRNANELALGAETKEQYLKRELDFLEQEKALNDKYYNDKFEAAKGDAAEQAKINEQRVKSTEKLAVDEIKIHGQLKQESLASYKAMFDSLTNGFQSMTEKLIRGTATWRDAFRQMCGDMIVDFAKMQVANVARLLWAAAIDKNVTIAGAITKRAANATTAAGGAWDAVVGIPIIGPALAPVAAAAAFAGVMAFGLPSAAGGWDNVPQDGLAMIHKNEMVLPSSLADKVRGMADSGSSSESSGHTFHFNISALDGNSVKEMFMKNGGIIVDSINRQTRNLNQMARAY